MWLSLVGGLPFLDLFLGRHSFTLFEGPLGYGPLICMYIFLPIFVVRYRFPVNLAIGLLATGIVGSSGVVGGIVELEVFLKIFGGLILSYSYYWYLWQYLEQDVVKAFRFYLNGATIVAAIGLLVFLDSILPFGFYELLNSFLHIGRDKAFVGIRVSGTMGEPTYFANAIAPAGFFAILRLFFSDSNISDHLKNAGIWPSKSTAILLLSSLLLTYSAMAYAGLSLALIFHLFLKKRLRTALFICAVFGCITLLVNKIPELERRITGVHQAITTSDLEVHGSSAILYNHLTITWENWSRNPWIGTGFGSHPDATNKYSILADTSHRAISEMNARDASSMLLRITSELGVAGLLLVFAFLYRNYFFANRTNTAELTLKFISVSFLLAILLNLLRQGNFVLHGFPFYVFGYYYAYQQFKKAREL